MQVLLVWTSGVDDIAIAVISAAVYLLPFS